MFVSSMISISGKTYRIVSVGPGTYDAVRLLDDVRVGSFGDGSRACVSSLLGGDALIHQIAQAAMRAAKTLWKPKVEL